MPLPETVTRLRPQEAIETARLILRKPVADDAEHLFKSYTSDIETVRYLTWRVHEKLSETVDYLAYCDCEWETGKSFPFAIVDAGAQTSPFGMIHMRQTGHAFSFGYVVARSRWNCGFATEALNALLDWSLGQPCIFRGWAFCDVDNGASARVMAKVGMSFEGVLRRYALHPNVSDEPRGARVYAKVVL